MATLRQVGELATTQLRDRAGQLVEALEETRARASSGSRAHAAGRRRSRGRNDAAEDELTKDELLDRAREVNLQGRSSMSKDELAEAVEAEESLTKEELLERAQEADIEGRSSMSKQEFRKALNEAGA
jgi:hypothetical protein